MAIVKAFPEHQPIILIVDDNAEALSAAARLLRKAGYEVAEAGDGAGALSLVRSMRPALVLLDVVLPDLSGLDVMRQIRADPALVGVSVVLLSSLQAAPEEQTAGLDAGADGYIARPIANTEMLARVRAQLRQHDLMERLRASEHAFRTLADSGQAFIWTAGPDKKCDYVNQPWLTFTGRTFEQERGDGWAEGVHPDDLARCFEIYTTSFDRHENFSMDFRMRRHDGEFRWIQDNGTPRFDSQGSL